MMGKDQDKHLDEYLSGSDGLSSLYAQGRNDEPSPVVDKKILQAARNAIPEKASGTGPFSGNWKIPVALAAVLVLAVGISITLERQTGSKSYRVERYSPEVSSPPTAKPKPAKKKEAERLRQSDRVQSKQPATPAAEPMLEAAPATARDKVNKPVAPEPAAEDVLQAPANLEPEQAAPMGNAAEGLMKQQDEETKLTEPAEPETAERWLQSIRDLVKQNKIDEAKQQLVDFRRVYPDYPLPEELKNLDR
jgi:hypothetical protein